jgi:hypothetical protein
MQHLAKMSLVNLDLPRSVRRRNATKKDCQGLTISAYSGNVFLGDLLIGQGGIGWRGAKKRIRKLNWTEFAQTMQSRVQNRAK